MAILRWRAALAWAGGVASLLAAGVVVRQYALLPRMRAPSTAQAPTSPEAVARGAYLFHHVAACAPCHSKIDETQPAEIHVEGTLGQGRDFGGPPAAAVHVRSSNLTPDRATGLGAWSDGEIVRAILEGVSRDGRPLHPEMPYETYGEHLSDDDAFAIVAYLRTLPPIAREAGMTTVRFPESMILRGRPKPRAHDVSPSPPESDVLARGNWLLALAACGGCHDAPSTDEKEPAATRRYAGGLKFELDRGRYVYVPNITNDPATGIGAHSDEDLRRVFLEGRAKDGHALHVMPWSYFGGMTEPDREAMLRALRRVPAVSHTVPASKL